MKVATAQLEALNVGPVAIAASNTKFSEVHESGDAVLELFVDDPTPGDTWDWSMSPIGGADNSAFTASEGIVPGRAVLRLARDPVASETFEISVRVLDSGGVVCRSGVFPIVHRRAGWP